MYKPIWPGTYYFNNFTFTSMGNSGHRGPTPDQTYADAPWPSSSYFSIKNGQQNWTVPANGTYQLTAAGAYGATPGRVVTSQVTLSEGQVLTMLVGQQPTPLTANVADNVTVGGGGGTFVTTNGIPLIAASGGDGSGPTSSPGSFLPSGSGTGGSGGGYYGSGSGTNPFFQFLVPYSYVNGGYGNSYEYGQPTLPENGGFGGGQSPIGLVTSIAQITGDGMAAVCTTADPHGYPFNYVVNISGTTYYDGIQTIQVLDPSTFVFASSNTQTVTSGTVVGLPYGGSSGGGGYTGSPGDGTSGATCYADPSVQNFTDLGATSNASGYVTISLVNPVPLVQSPTWNQTWTYQPSTFPYPTAWSACAYGNGTYVAVSNNGTYPVTYSTDGINWYTQTYGTQVQPWVSVTFGNDLFVSVAGNGSTMVSPDGINWTVGNFGSGAPVWTSVTAGNGFFVATATDIGAAYSPDGLTWTTSTIVLPDSWTSVTSGNGTFVAVANNGTTANTMYSADGNVWSNVTTGTTSNTWLAITYGNGTFVATAQSNVMYSLDGQNWTQGTPLNFTSNCLTCGNGYFAALSNNSSVPQVTVTTDVISPWQYSTVPSASYIGITYGAQGFVGVSPTTFTLSFTPSFWINPTQISNANKLNSSQWNGLAYGNGTFVAVGNGIIQGTRDRGSTWNLFQASNVSCITYSQNLGTFVGISNNFINGTYTSQDGLNWTQNTNLPVSVPNAPTAITYGNGLFVSVLNGDSNVLYSRDGVYWDVTTNGTAHAQWVSVAYGNGTYVAMSPTGSMTSLNGANWTTHTLPTGIWGFVTYENGLFVAVAAYGGSMYSSDGVSWFPGNLVIDTWSSVTYGNGYFMAVSNTGTYPVAYSQDGINWVTQTTGFQTANWGSIAFGQNTFMALNAQGASTMITQLGETF